jgi:hypothetical protein
MANKVGRPSEDKKRVNISINKELHEYYSKNAENFSKLIEELLKKERERVS